MYFRELLFDPNPFLFFEEALTVTDFPDFRPLMVQVVSSFFMVQVLPPAETLLPVSLDPPFDAGKEMVTLRFTLPFFTGIDSIEATKGAVGRVTLVFAVCACDGLVCRVATNDTTKIVINLIRNSHPSVAFRVHHSARLHLKHDLENGAYTSLSFI